MSDLKRELIKLGTTNPELRPHIREVLKASGNVAPPSNVKSANASLSKAIDSFLERSTFKENLKLALLGAYIRAEAAVDSHLPEMNLRSDKGYFYRMFTGIVLDACKMYRIQIPAEDNHRAAELILRLLQNK